MLTKQFDEETPPAYLAAKERFYKALGLIPADAEPADPHPRPAERRRRRRSTGTTRASSTSSRRPARPAPTERFYFSHEYDHALQDQHFTVFKDQKGILDQSDRILARQAVYEGDATLTDDPVGGRPT